ncbi:hypothetical protein JHK82_017855 [Glycine max]|nr:hypothetical protein JHK82_017855 [Glycine max]
MFAPKDKFFYNNNIDNIQLSSCDMRLSLSNANSQIFVFRPKVDKISHLINKLALAHSITHEETVKACTSQINGTSMRCTNAANTCRKNMEYLEFEEGLILVQRVATPYAIR